MIKKMEKGQSHMMPQWFKTNQDKVIDWIHYLYDEKNPAPSRIRCTLRHKNQEHGTATKNTNQT